jgi:hypothetical protein
MYNSCYAVATPRRSTLSARLASGLVLVMGAMLSTGSLAQQMFLSEAVQTPPNIVTAGTPISYQFKIENPVLFEYDPPIPDGSDGSVENYIQIRVDGQLVSAKDGPFSTTDCVVYQNEPDFFRCNDLAIDESQTVTFTWDSPEAGFREVDFVGTWNFVPPDILVGGTSDPHMQVFDTYIGYEKRQTLYESIEFSGNFPATSASGTIGAVWDGATTLNLVAGGDPICHFGKGNEAGKSCLADGGVACEEDEGICLTGVPATGFAFTLESAGSTGILVNVERPALTYSGEMPLSVIFELPEDGVVAPEELFTISTNWGTPYGTRPPLNGGARFEASDPGSIRVRLGQSLNLEFGLKTLSCFDGKCEAGQVDELPGPISGVIDFFTVGLNDAKNEFIQTAFDGTESIFDDLEELSWPEFLTRIGLSPSNVPDPLEYDILRAIKSDFAGLSRMGIGTNYDNVSAISATTGTQVPKHRSLSNGWSENVVNLVFDLTNIGPIAKGFACNCFVPLLNGTAEDLAAIALAKATPEDPLGKKTSAALNALYWLGGDELGYTIAEAELEGQFDVANNFQLTPRPPVLRIMNGNESLSNWFKAGDDVEVVMPLDPSDITVEIKLDSSFNSNLIVWERDVVIDFNALSLEAFGHSTDWWWNNPLRKKVYGTSVESPLGLTRQSDLVTSEVFERVLLFPGTLAEPRVGLSGGGGITFGGSDGSCWEPDNLPPDTPSGISWNENDGCVVSFRELGLNGQIILKSFSNSEVSLTLQNSTLNGQIDQLAQVELNPNGDTSVQFRGETRQSGIDAVDLFFDDALSTGNHNRLIFDTSFGGFIRNSLLRGQTSNENQSDIILRSGNLWIENTDMELDNITVEDGKISMQDSVADLRNLQLGGSAESALRMTRDSLITTSSNASWSSSLLEIGNGSLVNVSGQMNNQGEIDLEFGGWLAVLEGDEPSLHGRLTSIGQDPGIVNIVGMNYLEVTRAALALLPDPVPDPVSLFENQVAGSRLETGVLLLDGGEITNQVINNTGGSFLSLGGDVTDVAFTMAETANMLIARAPLMFSQSTISGTGNIEIEDTGTWVLDQAEIGDAEGEPNGLAVNNKGVISVASTAAFLSSSTIINEGTIEVDSGRELTVAVLQLNSGLLDIDGTLNVSQTAQMLGGRVAGTGTINGNLIFTNGELLANGLAIVGDFLQDSQASLTLDLILTPTPEITAESAELNGRLTIIMTQEYVDALVLGSGFEFMNYDSVGGEFTSIVLLLPDGSAVQEYGAEVIYGPNAASVRWLEAEEFREGLGELPIFRSGFEGGNQ